MLETFKYISWALTTIVPVAGQFFCKFTQDDPGHPNGYCLTRAGKYAVILTLAGILISFGLTIASDSQDAIDRQKLAADNSTMSTKLDDQTAQLNLALQDVAQLLDKNDDIQKQLDVINDSVAALQKNTSASGANAAMLKQIKAIQDNISNTSKFISGAIHTPVPPGVAAYRAKQPPKPVER